MLAFQALFHQLDQVTGTRAKVLLLVEHFRSVPAADAAAAAEKEAEEHKLQKAKNDASGLASLLADSETNTNNNSPDDLLSKNTNNFLQKTSCK